MAITYELTIQAQPSIYAPQERAMNIYFSEPQNGMNKKTGLLLLLAGYGGSATSNVFQKMRNLFADTYNLVTVQCDYFGYEYMQNNVPTNISDEMLKDTLSDAEMTLLQKNYDKYQHILKGKIFEQVIDLEERAEYCNDMGLMQAIDNLRAVQVVMDIIKNNGYLINNNRIYAYGFSHGGYLEYLCNRMFPTLFTAIIDNSSYLAPYYLKNNRYFSAFENGIRIDQKITYSALEYILDEEVLYLPFLYQNFENQANILCYAGEDDNITSLEEKKSFLNKIDNTKVETITKSRIDKIHFFNTNHGLGADFVKLFHHAYQNHIVNLEAQLEKTYKKEKRKIIYQDVSFDTKMFHYDIKWENGLPILYRKKW